jgi:hypothetical protein
MLYYNNIDSPFSRKIMTHHHHGGAPHPSPAISASLIRLSAPQRLAVAAALIALIWTAFFWATH